MKTLIIVALAASLTACGTIGGPTVSNYKPPVFDEASMTVAQKASLPIDLATCQELANSAITPFESQASLYSEAEMTRVTEKRRAVRRVCLQNRGYAILY